MGCREQSWALCQFARQHGYREELPFLYYVHKVSHGERLVLDPVSLTPAGIPHPVESRGGDGLTRGAHRSEGAGQRVSLNGSANRERNFSPLRSAIVAWSLYRSISPGGLPDARACPDRRHPQNQQDERDALRLPLRPPAGRGGRDGTELPRVVPADRHGGADRSSRRCCARRRWGGPGAIRH